MKGKIQFKEEQSFIGTWMFYLVIGITTLSFIGASITIWLNETKEEGIIGLIIAGVVCGGVVVLFIYSKLYVTIDDRAIYYRYPPFVNSEHKLTQTDIKEVYVREYNPIWEYGGWGYRIRPGKGRALNVSGNQGLQLELSNGKKILLGTQKPEAMKQAVRRLKENWGLDG
ncbi:hypothetical protein [Ekhidna sp.]|uniref:hypothetical protein n=1 Tax=Ekhidna sp. TaxID=2608089 RepID=UPI003CCC21B3